MQVGAKFENMTLTRKRKAVAPFMILELLEDPNDRVERGKTREWLKERAEKGMFQTVIQLSLQDTPAFKKTIQLPNPSKLASFPFFFFLSGCLQLALHQLKQPRGPDRPPPLFCK